MDSTTIKFGAAVQVYCKNPDSGAMLEDVTLRTLGGKLFVVGTLAPKGIADEDPRVGVTFWIAFDEVAMLADFPDLPTAQRMYTNYRRQNPDDAGNGRH